MQRTAIEWTDLSANPLKYHDADGNTVWGCVKVSPGCAHCYSEALAQRYRRGGPFNAATMRGLTPFLDDAELHKMLTAKTVGGRHVSGSRCFVGDMTDVFGEWVPDELLDRLFAVFAMRPDVTFQVLTKRPERMADWADYLKYKMGCPRSFGLMDHIKDVLSAEQLRQLDVNPPAWPLANVWLGTSVENQEQADARIPHLLSCPAAVRFLSVEPLLGPVDLHRQFSTRHKKTGWTVEGIDWVIVGGESGPGARPCHVEDVRSVVRQCSDAGVACFVKQTGANVIGEVRSCCGHRWLNGSHAPECPTCGDIAACGVMGYRPRDGKGGDPSEWSEDLRVREFPYQEAAR